MSLEDDKVTFCTIARAKLIEFDEIIRDRADKLERARQAYLRAGMGKGMKRYKALREDSRVIAAFEGLSRKIKKWAKKEPEENKRIRQQILDYMENKKTFPSTEDAAEEDAAKVLVSIPDFEATAAECARDPGLRDIDILSVTEEAAEIRQLKEQVEELKLQNLQLQRELTSSTDTVMFNGDRLTEQNEKLKEENARLKKENASLTRENASLTRENNMWNIENMKLKKEKAVLDKELSECKKSNACISAAVADEINKQAVAACAKSKAEKDAQNEQDQIDLRRAKEIKRAERAVKEAEKGYKIAGDASLRKQTQETINANKKRAKERLEQAKERLEEAKKQPATILGEKRKKPGLKLMSNLKL